MQSGGGSHQSAGAGGLGRSPASPSSSSLAVPASQQQQFDAIQQQQRQHAPQHQLLRNSEGNEAILAFQAPPGFQGAMRGANVMAAPNTLQYAQQQRKYLEMVQQQGSPHVHDEGQNKNNVHEQQGLNPVHYAYMQFDMAKQKYVPGMQPQGQVNLGIGSPSSGKDQDLRMANMKMQELVSMQTANQAPGLASKKPFELSGHLENQMEQSQQGYSDQRNEPKPHMMQTAMGYSSNITRPVQHPQGQLAIQNMGNNQMAIVAQVQAWAREQNIDLSQPMNANLMAQLMPLMQSRMMAQQRTNEGSSLSPLVSMQLQKVASPPVASVSSPHANSSSEVSGSSGAIRSRQTAPPGPFCSASTAGTGNNTNNSSAQFSVPTGQNQSSSMQPMMGNGVGSVQVSLPSMNLHQGSEYSMNGKNAATSQELVQMQYLRQINQSLPRPPSATNAGARGNSLRPSVEPSQDIQQQTGFTKQLLHVLKAQILAFRRLKKGESALPQELLRAIAPPPLDSLVQLPDVPAASTSQGTSSVRKVDESSQHLESVEKASQAPPPSLAKNVFEEEISPVDEKAKTSTAHMAVVIPVTREASSALPSEKVDQQSVPIAVKAEQDAERSMQKTPVRNDLNLDMGKAIASPASAGESIHAKKPLQAGSISQTKDIGSNRKYHGPLFDFPCFTRKHDSLGSSVVPNNNLTLAYDIKDIISMEGMEVLKNRRVDNLRKIGELLAANLGRKRIRPDLVVRLQIEEKKLKLLDLQACVRAEVDQVQQDIMGMNDREYRKFVRICERQRLELSRQVQASQKAMREKQLKSIFQWRKKLLEAHWAIRDARTACNRGVAKYHERMLREFSKRKDDDRNKRMEALKNNDVERYREMLLEQQTSIPGDAAERYAVLSTFLTQTEEYLLRLGSKITASKSQQEVQEAAAAAAAAARAQGLSEEEVRAAAACAGEEVMIRNQFSEMNAPKDKSSVNKYYTLAHAINESVVRQPSMLRAGTLRDYQLVGLQWMLSLYNNKLNGILADEMGLGKTVQVMSLIAYLMEFKGNYGPHLIIVPNAVLVNWKSELHTWLPSVSCIYYVGTKDQRAKLFSQEVCAMKFNVLVTTYEFIMFDRSKLCKVDWKYIIIDEAQRMKDRESVLARDLDKYRCQRRLLLTGTPLQNDLKELWSLLNLLLPEVFDNRKAFHDWFSQPFQKEGPTHNAEDDWLETEKKVIIIHRLHQILEPFMLRRRLEDVEGSLPPKVSFVLKCKMSAIQSAIYDWVKTTGTLRLDPEDEKLRVQRKQFYQSRAYRTLNNRCMELRKICNHPLLTYPYFNDFSKDFLVKSCGKLWILDRILIKLQRTGHRVLLFSTMTKLLDILEEYLQWRRLLYRRIDGTTTLEDRESAIVDFNDPNSECFIFLLSIRAAGRGLNLQTADTVIIYDPDPNPKNEEQAVARAHRIGQTREVKVIYMEAVVDKISSHIKEDEFRSGGVADLEDDLAGKDRYMGSIESLIRNNIQQYKIDMADEVINAGRFDQRTTHEERRMTLETLLHDEERYQETVHDVPSLQEVNRMIARSEEEVELFDQMDEEFDWIEEMTRYEEVPEWLRTSTVEVNAAIFSLSKKPLKDIMYNNVVEESGDTERRGRNKGKKVVYTELDDDIGESSDASSGDRNGYSAPEDEGEGGGEDEDEDEDEDEGEDEDGEDAVALANKDLSDIAPGNDGYDYPRASTRSAHMIEEPGSPGSSSNGRRMVRAVSPSTSSQKFTTFSAFDARPSSGSRRLVDGLEEGEISLYGDSHLDVQQSGSCNHEREEGEDEQVLQPKIKRKRSIRLRPRPTIERSEERYSEKLSHQIQRGEPSKSQSLAVKKFERQLRNDSKSKKVGEFAALKQDLNEMSAKAHRVLPSGRTGSTSKLHTSTKPGRLNSLSNPLDEAGENCWDGNKDANKSGNSSAGAKMPEFIQKRCKFVIGKVQRRLDKEGHVVPLLSDFWKRTESSGYTNGPGNKLLDLHKIDHRIDKLQYGGVMDVVNDVQLMLKCAVQHYRFSHEVTCEARKFHEMFIDTLEASFPDIDFQEARNSMFLYGPPLGIASAPLKAASSSQGIRKQRLMNEVERNMSPSPRQQMRGPNMTYEDSRAVSPRMPMKESRLGSNSSSRDRGQERDMGQQNDSPLLTHPGDLVVCKKKRKDREKPVVITKSGSTGPFSPPSMGGSIRSPGSMSTPRENRAVAQQQMWSNHSAQPVNGSIASFGWANPVKRSRTDAGKRRPSLM